MRFLLDTVRTSVFVFPVEFEYCRAKMDSLDILIKGVSKRTVAIIVRAVLRSIYMQ